MYWDEDWWYRRTPAPRFRLALVTPPVLTPIEVNDAKVHARIRHDDEDGQVLDWIRAATRKVEHDTELVLLTSTWDLTLTSFPDPLAAITFPIRPIQSVPATQYVKYYDAAGVLQTFDAADYLIDPPTLSLALALDAEWPSDVWQMRPVVVRFVAGYTAADLVPEDLRQAVRLLVAHFSEQRQATQAGEKPELISLGYEALIAPYVRHLAA